jgi:hypothetical protein
MRAAVLLTLSLALPAAQGLALALPEADKPGPPGQVMAPTSEATRPDRLPVPPGSRGQMLYENHCMGCHESVLFIRERRDVKTLPDLRKEVSRWAAEAKAPWWDMEIDEVTSYLNRTYYRLPEQ